MCIPSLYICMHVCVYVYPMGDSCNINVSMLMTILLESILRFNSHLNVSATTYKHLLKTESYKNIPNMGKCHWDKFLLQSHELFCGNTFVVH